MTMHLMHGVMAHDNDCIICALLRMAGLAWRSKLEDIFFLPFRRGELVSYT